MYKNSEGYSSPTEGMAISHVMKEYRQQQKKRYADKTVERYMWHQSMAEM